MQPSCLQKQHSKKWKETSSWKKVVEFSVQLFYGIFLVLYNVLILVRFDICLVKAFPCLSNWDNIKTANQHQYDAELDTFV